MLQDAVVVERCTDEATLSMPRNIHEAEKRTSGTQINVHHGIHHTFSATQVVKLAWHRMLACVAMPGITRHRLHDKRGGPLHSPAAWWGNKMVKFLRNHAVSLLTCSVFALGAVAISQQHKIKRLQADMAVEAQAGCMHLRQLDRYVSDLWHRYEVAVADAKGASQQLRRAETMLHDLQAQYSRVFGQQLSYAASFFKWDAR
jgi:hypothetical protein